MALCLLLSATAHAFSDPQAYADPVDVGGGGGRWFTGSSADGYGCDVCHTGNAGADLAISGLPLTGYVPGQAYEIGVTWPASVKHLALIAEFSDEQRHGAGTVALPRPEAFKPTELCGMEGGGQPASDLHDAEGGRKLVSVIDCGAQELRMQWIAPPSAASALWFNLGFVTSNQNAGPSGDGVTLVRRVIPAADHALGTRVVAQPGCNTLGQSQSEGSGISFLLLMAVGMRARARKALLV